MVDVDQIIRLTDLPYFTLIVILLAQFFYVFLSPWVCYGKVSCFRSVGGKFASKLGKILILMIIL